MCVCMCQMVERLGNRAINQKVAGSVLPCHMTLCPWGKALHPTSFGGNVPVLTLSRSGASAK